MLGSVICKWFWWLIRGERLVLVCLIGLNLSLEVRIFIL